MAAGAKNLTVTDKPLYLSSNPYYDWIVAVEFGSVVDGKCEDEYIPLDESLRLILREPGGEVIGFVLDNSSYYEILKWLPGTPDVRFDVPVLGLVQASPLEILASTRATFGEEGTPDVYTFEHAVNIPGGEEAVEAWRYCLATGNLKAHFALGCTYWELGRFHEGTATFSSTPS